jgi:hypothetical protein
VKGEYDALVVTGALTEVEFWAPRAALLAAHAASTSSGGAGHSLQPAKTLSAGRTLGISNMMLDMNVRRIQRLNDKLQNNWYINGCSNRSHDQ